MTGPARLPARTADDAPSDGSLLRRLRGGSEDAATQLYLRYAHRLRALARASSSPLLARRVDADDIVQSVFRVFFDGASKGLYDVPDGDGLWKLLLVIALNKVRMAGLFHTAKKRDVRVTADFADPEPVADDRAETDRLNVVVRDTLATLPEAERRLIELRLDGHEVAEIAAVVGRSKRTVERLLQQARGRLKTLLT